MCESDRILKCNDAWISFVSAKRIEVEERDMHQGAWKYKQELGEKYTEDLSMWFAEMNTWFRNSFFYRVFSMCSI